MAGQGEGHRRLTDGFNRLLDAWIGPVSGEYAAGASQPFQGAPQFRLENNRNSHQQGWQGFVDQPAKGGQGIKNTGGDHGQDWEN